jgi:hypothetical protein
MLNQLKHLHPSLSKCKLLIKKADKREQSSHGKKDFTTNINELKKATKANVSKS